MHDDHELVEHSSIKEVLCWVGQYTGSQERVRKQYEEVVPGWKAAPVNSGYGDEDAVREATRAAIAQGTALPARKRRATAMHTSKKLEDEQWEQEQQVRVQRRSKKRR